jgi:hypothetical protein
MKKACAKCKLVKVTSDFHKDSSKRDGYRVNCKSCVKEYQNLDYVKEIKKRAAKKYYRTEWGLGEQRKISRRNWLKNKASGRAKIYYDVRHSLVKEPCLVCGTNTRVHAHHDDYTKPLDVMWLCPEHHSDRHKYLKERMNG